MENNNENVGFDELMAKYDFDSPIKVTVVIEEEEDQPDPFSLKGLLLAKESNISNTNTDNAQNKIPNANNIRKSNSVIKENNHSINKLILSEQIQEETQDIRYRLLDFVADNLIRITKYYYYFGLSNNNKELGNNKKPQTYLNFKHHFFNLSYSATITILLPHENNIPFLNNFIHRVIKIANDSSWYQISFNNLEILVHEMLIWSKNKKHYHELKFRSHNHRRSGMDCWSTAPTICNSVHSSEQDLNRPIYDGLISYHSRQGTNGLPDIVPKTYLPTQRINTLSNLNDTTNYLTQEMTSPPNISSRSSDLPQDIVNSINNGYVKNISEHKRTESHNVCRKNFHSKQDINISPYSTQRPNRSNLEISASFNTDHRTKYPETRSRLPCIRSRINHSTETISSLSSSEPKTNSNNYQAMNTITHNKEIFLSTGPPNQKITISVDPAVLANINQQNTNQIINRTTEYHDNEAYGMESIKRRKTNDDRCSVNNSYYQKNNCSATTLQSQGDSQRHDDSLRSSISRDSGCGGSPIYGSIRNEEMIGPFVTEEQVTPVISHVTSMNPNAVNLNSGSCTVCGAITNNMCIECYQKYYCSSLCQIKDWDIHKYLCSR